MEKRKGRAGGMTRVQAGTGALIQQIARLACRALLYEVCTTPKPGLVDCRNCGSHSDMDVFTFLDSAIALQPYFARCAAIGAVRRKHPAAETFPAVRRAGRRAEETMRQATGGVNTHKGAIFSMGVLCAAVGRLPRGDWGEPARVLQEASAIVSGVTARDLSGLTEETARTVGERLYVRHGMTGVRGQAEAGFPAVLLGGLPALERGLAEGRTLQEAGCAALLALMAVADDTNLIARSDLDTQRRVAAEAAALLAKTPYPDFETLARLDDAFIAQNLSPGGSADLLAICYLLHFLRDEGSTC